MSSLNTSKHNLFFRFRSVSMAFACFSCTAEAKQPWDAQLDQARMVLHLEYWSYLDDSAKSHFLVRKLS